MGEVTNTLNKDMEIEAEKVRHSSELNSRLISAKDESPEEIRREIEQTRREMDGTMDMIRNRIEMEELATDAFESVKRVWRDKHPDVLGAARRNPGPTALAALGLGWMLARGTAGPEFEGRLRHKIGEKTGNVKHRIGEKAFHVKERIGEKATHAKESIGEKAFHAKERLSNKSEEIKYRAGQGTSQIGQQIKGKTSEMLHGTAEGTRHVMGRSRESFSETLQSNPFAVGAVALAVGAAVGLMFPLSSPEHKAFEKISDEFKSINPERNPESPMNRLPESTMERDMGMSGDYTEDGGI